ncbi:MAG: hypothetical protein E6G04_11705 [Actinobacteria bacterium]|nr:MAG: hypothetical protein E6G04_11705 [Actinomycetota bacterium]
MLRPGARAPLALDVRCLERFARGRKLQMRRAWVLAVILLLAACSSGKPSPTPSSTTTPRTSKSSVPIGADWPVYHHDNERSGVASDQAPMKNFRRSWTSARLDELVYAQPLAVGNQVIVASEGNTVYSLDASNGTIKWRRPLGAPVNGGSLPCGNINPTGITGTPAIDPGAGVVYVVAFLRTGPHHELFALDLSSGAVRWHRTIDPPGLSAVVEQERGALALGGSVWVTTGNTASSGAFDFGNAVVKLTSALRVSDYFAPTDWVALNAGDVDLGSVGPVLMSGGRAFAAGKAGIVYLLERNKLGHVGGEVTSKHVCSRAFGQPAVQGSMVFVACEDSLVAVRVGSKTLSVVWTSSGESGPTIVAAGAVWTMKGSGVLTAFNPSSGKVLEHVSLGAPATRFIAPSAAGGRLFVADGNRIVAFALH